MNRSNESFFNNPQRKDKRDPLNVKTFLMAARNGDIAYIGNALAAGLAPDSTCYIVARSKFHVEGCGAMHEAAANGHVGVIELLLSCDVPVDHKTKDGWTPLHAAICNHQPEVAIFLTKQGADIYIDDPFGRNAIEEAKYIGLSHSFSESLVKIYDAHRVLHSDSKRTKFHACSYYEKIFVHFCIYELIKQSKDPLIENIEIDSDSFMAGSLCGDTCRTNMGMPSDWNQIGRSHFWLLSLCATRGPHTIFGFEYCGWKKSSVTPDSAEINSVDIIDLRQRFPELYQEKVIANESDNSCTI